MDELSIEPVTPAIGAKVHGVDLARISGDTADLIYRALLDHQVLFFRGQELTPAAHLSFARHFGEVDRPHQVYPHVEGHPEIVLLENDSERQPDTDCWHTDLTFYPDPPFASVLVARHVPEVGGDTMWASMYAAYQGLPSPMRSQVDELFAVHDPGSFRNGFISADGEDLGLSRGMHAMGTAVHPVAPVHPVTGRRFLYVNPGFTVHIAGWSTPDSNRLLTYLYDHVDRPEYQVRFRWRNGSVAMWDNRVTQHYALNDYAGSYRCMNRVTVVADRRAPASGMSHPYP